MTVFLTPAVQARKYLASFKIYELPAAYQAIFFIFFVMLTNTLFRWASAAPRLALDAISTHLKYHLQNAWPAHRCSQIA